MLLKLTIVCAVLAALSALLATPRSRRERRLRKHGRVATAICREHLNPADPDGPMRIRCGFRVEPHRGEYRVVVRTREHVPQVGEELRIAYDPGDPGFAENLEYMTAPAYGREDLVVVGVWVAAYLVMASCAAGAG
ncbi:putative secreted protein [Streptomyces davaonensis JCM 4913]|uniref:Putative secreted protein n=1 Tax=Streptomyces davaonensis (strain DSM 101723 / JCM 4913 / KCC S-0913 / 768) TaxID=1214101 RepID=K4R4C7_STRDJ|nr:hypothetical protein [Streptomyces davaonensis]CCK27977.1 putative secreted protein [Streptomyces davaonensis JCM 4913]